MPEVVIWGGAGQAKVVAEALSGSEYRIIAIFDNREVPSPVHGVETYLGQSGFRRWLTDHPSSPNFERRFVVAIGGAHGRARLEIGDFLQAHGLTPLTIVHPRAWIAHDAIIGESCQILAGAMVASGARIGRASIVNTGASIDHECVVAEGVHVGPGAVLAGEVNVEFCAFIGAGATILPRCRIGADFVVGAGSIVNRDVELGATVVGNPARPIVAGRERKPPPRP